MDEEAQARKRLLIYSLARGVGLLVFFLGIAIIYTDLLRKGGWPQLGALLAIVGVLDAFVSPRLIKRQWDEQDRNRE